MRPNELNMLFTDVTTLKGVGDGSRAAIGRLVARFSPSLYGGSEHIPTIAKLRDLLFHLPSGVIDRREIIQIIAVRDGAEPTLKVKVIEHFKPARISTPYKVSCTDGTGDVMLVFFKTKGDWIASKLHIGQEYIISGRCERFDSILQMPHPDVIVPLYDAEKVLRLEPVYPLTYAITSKRIATWQEQILQKINEFPEWIDPSLVEKHRWPSWKTALSRLHNPIDPDDIAPQSHYRERLAYDELLSHQLALALVRRNMKKKAGIPIPAQSPLAESIEKDLPFTLTEGQKTIVQDIVFDMSSGSRMTRLLQGDVGSGKTVVALMAALHVIESGHQVALMSPTEILARQHHASLSKMLEYSNVKTMLLTGSLSASERGAALKAIASGEAQIIIGTHALFQTAVTFHKLGLVVIDEQHRFGVAQRIALTEKGQHPHVLLMTATPIPRSLTMVMYGDMESSNLREKPLGRQEIQTRAVPSSRVADVIDGLKRKVAKGEKIYWICPLVAEGMNNSLEGLTEAKGDEPDIQAAQERHRALTSLLGNRVGLVHGQMKADYRQEIMQGFAGDNYDVLVATTVIEVGVDIPAATVIVIENAERFGLSQLHQLRGRVGRGDKASSCILLYHPSLSETSKERLKIIREHTDGFLIAEEDLRLRGSGEILGTRQSGMPDFIFADPWQHRTLIATARDDVKLILERDPELATARGHALRILLYLLGQDKGVKLLDGG